MAATQDEYVRTKECLPRAQLDKGVADPVRAYWTSVAERFNSSIADLIIDTSQAEDFSGYNFNLDFSPLPADSQYFNNETSEKQGERLEVSVYFNKASSCRARGVVVSCRKNVL